MHVEWYGQSAFCLTSTDATVVAVDPFDVSALTGHGMQFDYPPIDGVQADLLLVTHEHPDHNGINAVGGDPPILRSTAGRLESPIGEIIAIASEHDEAAGTERGPNTIFVFELDGLRVCHFGDFGQSALRPEQAEVIGRVDLLFLPVGGGPRSARSRPRRSSNACPRAGPCRCTTALRASASWRRPTPSWRAQPAWSACRRPRSPPLNSLSRTARSSSSRRHRRAGV